MNPWDGNLTRAYGMPDEVYANENSPTYASSAYVDSNGFRGYNLDKMVSSSITILYADSAMGDANASVGWYRLGVFNTAVGTTGIYLVHNNRANLAYADGHAAAKTKEELHSESNVMRFVSSDFKSIVLDKNF